MKDRSDLQDKLESLLDRVARVEGEVRILTPQLHTTLSAAARCGRKRGISGISRSAGFSHATTKEYVHTLEDMGLIHRIARESQFSNFHSVIVTRAGVKALLSHENIDATVEERVLANLENHEHAMFLDILDRLTKPDDAKE